MNIVVLIGLVLVIISFSYIFALYRRITELHEEKPHVIPAWLSLIIIFVLFIHIISAVLLSGILFFPEIIDKYLAFLIYPQ